MSYERFQAAIDGEIPQYADLCFKVQNGEGVWEEYHTKNFNMIPTGPLHLNAFEEKYETIEASSYHGSPEKVPLSKRLYKNSTGTWEMYYIADGGVHTSWDDYGANADDDVRERIGMPNATETSNTLYQDWRERTGAWTSTYFRIMRILQGALCTVTLYKEKTAHTDEESKTYTGRCWISGVKNDDTGRVILTISYDLEPPEDYTE